MKAGATGCAALAEKVLGALKAGPRRLDLTGGSRALGNGFALNVPPNVAMASKPGPDFDIFQFFEIVELGKPSTHMGIYFGYHPSFRETPGAKKTKAQILGSPVIWDTLEAKGGWLAEVLVPAGGHLKSHIFAQAPTEEALKPLMDTAATIVRKK